MEPHTAIRRPPRGLSAALIIVMAGAAAGDEPRAAVPPGVSAEELEARREALRALIFEPAVLESSSFRLAFERSTSSFRLEDMRTGVGWHTALDRKGFASVELRGGGPVLPVDGVEELRIEEKEIRFRGRSSMGGLPEVRFRLGVLGPLVGLEVSVEVPPAAAERVQAVRILDRALWVADADGGGAVLPRGLGEWMAAEEGSPVERRFVRDDGPWSWAPATPAPEQATLSALGLVRGEAALLVLWDTPGTLMELRRGPVEAPGFPGRGGITPSFVVPSGGGVLRLYPLGKGDRIDLAHSHRQLIAKEKDPPSLRRKCEGREELRTLMGAAVLRPRIMAGGPGARPAPLRSFEEVARLAERWRKTLEIDQALIVLDGWSAREAGQGGAGPLLADADNLGGAMDLAACAERVRALGYLFGLRAPAVQGISKELASLKARVAPDLLLLPAPRGPAGEVLALAAEAQSQLGMAGSEGAGEAWLRSCGYLEGLLSHKVNDPTGASSFPLFAFSYGHCARMAVLPEEAVEPDQPERLLAHLALGEVPVYALPARGGEEREPPAEDPRGCFTRSDGGWAEGKGLTARERFAKNTFEVLSHAARIRFRAPLLYHRWLTPDRTVEETYFGEDLRIVVNYGEKEYSDADAGFTLPRYGFWVQHPYFHAFHALRAHGLEYPRPALFTVRSLEGKMYLRAEAARIYHGFGPSVIRLGGRDFDVRGEATVKIW